MNVRTWTRYQRNRIASWALLGLGGTVLILGWLGVARATYPAQQLPYLISGGLGGVCLVGMGALLWLSSDLEDEWTKLDLIEDALRTLAEQGAPIVENHDPGAERHSGIHQLPNAPADSREPEPARQGKRRQPLTAGHTPAPSTNGRTDRSVSTGG